MQPLSELVQLIRHAIGRTGHTVRLCLLLLCAAPAAGVALYVYCVVLPEVMRR